MQNEAYVQELIDEFQYYHVRVSNDGIDGLEAKLKQSGRQDMFFNALRQKEAFDRKKDKFVHFCAAQEICSLN